MRTIPVEEHVDLSHDISYYDNRATEYVKKVVAENNLNKLRKLANHFKECEEV